MDIVQSKTSAAVVLSSKTTQPATLIHQLAGLGETLGIPLAAKMLPGNIPSIEVTPEFLLPTMTYLCDHLSFDLLSLVSGVDMGEHFDVIYHLHAIKHKWLIQIKVHLPPGKIEVDSMVGLWQTANWLERETYDMFGIIFLGHPDLRRILLDDEFQGFPLRKDFHASPTVVHDPATTQVDPERAVTGEQIRNLGHQRAIMPHMTQGDQERLHPGTPTLGHSQAHGKHFPPQTWKHALDQAKGTPDHK
jgi:NADH/F420H2 dehydrogenase subunit C